MSKNYQKSSISIKGMHCKSCEMLIEEELSAVPGVKEVKADWHNSSVEICYEGKHPESKEISTAIAKAGYDIGENEKTGFFSRHPEDYRDLGVALLILFGIYLALKGLGLNSLSFTSSNDLTVPVILLVGLTAGFSSCMALVGGLILGVSAKYSEQHPEATPAEKFYPHLLFNSGRVFSYAILGGLLGLLGSAFQLSVPVLSVITIIVGLIMLLMGLQLINIFPWADKIKFTLPSGIARAFGMKKKQNSYSHNGTFMLGALTFFLPCGFTQAMQVYAVSTGSFFSGAIIMGAFALGTMPGLLSIGGITSTVKGLFARRFFQFAGVAVIAFAVLNISNGLSLAGIDVSFQPSQTAITTTSSSSNVNSNVDPNVREENGVQVVYMKETGRGYEPNSFTIKKGAPVKWIINAQEPYSCAASLVLSQYNIRKNLVLGENIIEFTPNQVGRVRFSCSMGMYVGAFNVIE